MKKLAALVLALVMLICLMPVGAMAVDGYSISGKGDGVSWSGTFEHNIPGSEKSGTAGVTFTITDNDIKADGVQIPVQDVISAILNLSSVGSIVPGNQFILNITLKNESGTNLLYKDSSLNVDTEYELFDRDGNPSNMHRIANMNYSCPPIQSLLGNNPSASAVADIYDTLENYKNHTGYNEAGYTGEYALRDYFVDFYKNKLNLSSLTWEQLITTYFYGMGEGASRINGISECFMGSNENIQAAGSVTQEQKNGALYTKYAVGYSSGIALKWPDKALAQLSYDIYYNELMTLVIGETPSYDGSSTGYRDYGLGDYANRKGNRYTAANSYLSEGVGKIKNGDSATIRMALTLEGPGTGNVYANYAYSVSGLFSLSLTLVPQTADLTIKKVNNGATPESATVKVLSPDDDGNDTVVKNVTLSGANNWTETVKVLPGTYKIVETNVDITGYTYTTTYSSEVPEVETDPSGTPMPEVNPLSEPEQSSDCKVEVGEDGLIVTVTNTYTQNNPTPTPTTTPSGGHHHHTTPTPTPVIIPKKLPKSGDMTLWGAILDFFRR